MSGLFKETLLSTLYKSKAAETIETYGWLGALGPAVTGSLTPGYLANSFTGAAIGITVGIVTEAAYRYRQMKRAA